MEKYLNYQEALAKLQAYCAYQERCHKEVREKLLDLGIYGDELENIIADLIEEKFLDELRFTIAFVGGKFRAKKWGRIKIKQALKQKDISDYCVRKAFQSEISPEDYEQTLIQVITKKQQLTAAENVFQRNQKLAKYAMSRGFESDIVWYVIKAFFAE